MAKVKVVTGPKGTVMKFRSTGKTETYSVARDTKNMSTRDINLFSPKIREQAQKKKVKPKKKTK